MIFLYFQRHAMQVLINKKEGATLRVAKPVQQAVAQFTAFQGAIYSPCYLRIQ